MTRVLSAAGAGALAFLAAALHLLPLPRLLTHLEQRLEPVGLRRHGRPLRQYCAHDGVLNHQPPPPLLGLGTPRGDQLGLCTE